MISVINNSRANAQGLGERRAWRFHRWTCLDPAGARPTERHNPQRPTPGYQFFRGPWPAPDAQKKGDASGAAFGHLIASL